MSVHFILNLHGRNLLLFLQVLYLTFIGHSFILGLNATVGNLTYTNDPVIGNIIPGSAAEQAHLQSNDRILPSMVKRFLHGMKSALVYKVLPIMVLLL